MTRSAVFRVGCDIGGTFTDFVVLDETTGRVFIEKRLTTSPDPSAGMLDGLRALGDIECCTACCPQVTQT